jgi:hypothetical protein
VVAIAAGVEVRAFPIVDKVKLVCSFP